MARRADELKALAAETGCEWHTCDLSHQDQIARLLEELTEQGVDVLVNNAGHSIRRRIVDASDRLHDYQRTMALNYFAAVQLSLGLLPGMIERGRGQFVNVCTWALHANTFPRFSAYAASKKRASYFRAQPQRGAPASRSARDQRALPAGAYRNDHSHRGIQ